MFNAVLCYYASDWETIGDSISLPTTYRATVNVVTAKINQNLAKFNQEWWFLLYNLISSQLKWILLKGMGLLKCNHHQTSPETNKPKSTKPPPNSKDFLCPMLTLKYYVWARKGTFIRLTQNSITLEKYLYFFIKWNKNIQST